jgi:hypothetical protein
MFAKFRHETFAACAVRTAEYLQEQKLSQDFSVARDYLQYRNPQDVHFSKFTGVNYNALKQNRAYVLLLISIWFL